jgi:hypothetical protein
MSSSPAATGRTSHARCGTRMCQPQYIVDTTINRAVLNLLANDKMSK